MRTTLGQHTGEHEQDGVLHAGETRESQWIKATSSYGSGNCVEVAITPGGVVIRDSKDPDGPRLRYTEPEFRAFLDAAKKGEFDRLL